MLSLDRPARIVATAATFAALYAILGAIPISPYVVGPGYLPANKIIAPLAGMLFGPIPGGLAVLIGNAVDFAYRGQVRYDTALADLAVVLTAGLAYTDRRRLALALPVVLVVAFTLAPLSVNTVEVLGLPVPFAWMHISSIVVFAGALVLNGRGRLGKLSPAFVGATAFASLMCGQIAGTLVGEAQAALGVAGFTPTGWLGFMVVIFYRYPLERIFYTVAAIIVSVPVLRAVSRNKGEAKGSG